MKNDWEHLVEPYQCWEALIELYREITGGYAMWNIVLLWGQRHGIITRLELDTIASHAIRYGW